MAGTNESVQLEILPRTQPSEGTPSRENRDMVIPIDDLNNEGSGGLNPKEVQRSEGTEVSSVDGRLTTPTTKHIAN